VRAASDGPWRVSPQSPVLTHAAARLLLPPSAHGRADRSNRASPWSPSSPGPSSCLTHPNRQGTSFSSKLQPRSRSMWIRCSSAPFCAADKMLWFCPLQPMSGRTWRCGERRGKERLTCARVAEALSDLTALAVLDDLGAVAIIARVLYRRSTTVDDSGCRCDASASHRAEVPEREARQHVAGHMIDEESSAGPSRGRNPLSDRGPLPRPRSGDRQTDGSAF
jgi:hypothetical protein